MCCFGPGFRVRVFSPGSRLIDNISLSLTQVPNPRCFFYCVKAGAQLFRVCVGDSDQGFLGAWVSQSVGIH